MHPLVFTGFRAEGDEGIFKAGADFAPADIRGLVLVEGRLDGGAVFPADMKR